MKKQIFELNVFDNDTLALVAKQDFLITTKKVLEVKVKCIAERIPDGHTIVVTKKLDSTPYLIETTKGLPLDSVYSCVISDALNGTN